MGSALSSSFLRRRCTELLCLVNVPLHLNLRWFSNNQKTTEMHTVCFWLHSMDSAKKASRQTPESSNRTRPMSWLLEREVVVGCGAEQIWLHRSSLVSSTSRNWCATRILEPTNAILHVPVICETTVLGFWKPDWFCKNDFWKNRNSASGVVQYNKTV